ncbi:MAG: MerR family transcriptional regulator [Coxiellaceae bacterium]|nr:MerR family transcriptional regulator [Coxiellaceae bacterium]
MPYTVKQLSALSGVSVRTIHYYDEIGLLAPAYCGDNNYRYYEEKQLLLLQQILFYRELGFQLDDIKKFIYSDDFNQVDALLSHKELLTGDLDRISKLIKTIDKTVAHLRGVEMVKLEEIFEGFTDEKQKLYEEFLVESGVDERELSQVRLKVKGWTKDQWRENKRDNDQVYAELAKAIDDKLLPASPEVQALIHRHYELVKLFWTPTKQSYIGLGQLYCSNPDFIKFYDDIHPELLDFLIQAMGVYAEKQLP